LSLDLKDIGSPDNYFLYFHISDIIPFGLGKAYYVRDVLKNPIYIPPPRISILPSVKSCRSEPGRRKNYSVEDTINKLGTIRN
jgi:hypothetical protein